MFFLGDIVTAQTINFYKFDSQNRLIKESSSPDCHFITYQYDQDGNRLSDTLRILQFNVTQQNIDCSHPIGSIALTPASSGAFSYVWSTGSTGNSVSVSQAGTYTVTITESTFNNVCSREYFVYADSTQAVASIYGNTSFCQNSSTTLSTNTGTSYLWSNGATTPTITVSTAGTYSVTVTDSTGCIRTSQAINVNSIPVPNHDYGWNGFTHSCENDSVVFNAIYQQHCVYQWFNDTIPISGITNDTVFILHTNAVINLQVTDTVTGCSSFSPWQDDFYFIDFPDTSITLTGNNPFCDGDSLILSLDEPSVIPGWVYDIFWYKVGTAGSIGIDTLFTVTTAGQYYALIDNSACYEFTDTLTVTISPVDTANFFGLPDTVCLSDSPIALSGFPFGGIFSGTGIVDSTFTPSNAGVGFHTIAYSFTNSFGCTDTASKAVYVDACVVGFTEIVNVYGQLSISPNPTDQELLINFSIPERKKVHLSIIDEQGKLIESLINGNYLAGGYTHKLNTSQLTPGSYFVYLVESKNLSVKKFVIQR